jgi:hypothetical protein
MHALVILVSSSSRALAEPVVKAFAGQVKFVQTSPPPIPFCAQVKEVPPHICQIGDRQVTTAPFVNLAETDTAAAIESVKSLIQSAAEQPSVLQMGRSALGDLIKWGSVKFGRCTQEQIDHRLAECKQCPHWDPSGFNGTGRCKKCGCSTWAKLKLKSSSCPEGRWQEINIEETCNLDTVETLIK